MADLSITAANVVKGSDAKTIDAIAGETITAGMAVVRDPTTRKILKADVDSATAALRDVIGIALNGASLNQPITVQTEGDITIGATLTANEIYLASNTAGGIMPEADLSAGEYAVLLGIAISTSVLRLKINKSGVAS